MWLPTCQVNEWDCLLVKLSNSCHALSRTKVLSCWTIISLKFASWKLESLLVWINIRQGSSVSANVEQPSPNNLCKEHLRRTHDLADFVLVKLMSVWRGSSVLTFIGRSSPNTWLGRFCKTAFCLFQVPTVCLCVWLHSHYVGILIHLLSNCALHSKVCFLGKVEFRRLLKLLVWKHLHSRQTF